MLWTLRVTYDNDRWYVYTNLSTRVMLATKRFVESEGGMALQESQY